MFYPGPAPPPPRHHHAGGSASNHCSPTAGTRLSTWPTCPPDRRPTRSRSACCAASHRSGQGTQPRHESSLHRRCQPPGGQGGRQPPTNMPRGRVGRQGPMLQASQGCSQSLPDLQRGAQLLHSKIGEVATQERQKVQQAWQDNDKGRQEDQAAVAVVGRSVGKIAPPRPEECCGEE
jgi:hypothetical protein